MWPAATAGVEDSAIPKELLQVIAENHQVFQALPALPPHCYYDHAITLKEGAVIPNLRPYWYPHYQKMAIEDLVKEMLDSGIIRPSISPFANPIILVMKKDGS